MSQKADTEEARDHHPHVEVSGPAHFSFARGFATSVNSLVYPSAPMPRYTKNPRSVLTLSPFCSLLSIAMSEAIRSASADVGGFWRALGLTPPTRSAQRSKLDSWRSIEGLARVALPRAI